MKANMALVLAIGLSSLSGGAAADQYFCDAVKNLAKCAAPHETLVSVIKNKDRQECGFSIAHESLKKATIRDIQAGKFATLAVLFVGEGNIPSKLQDVFERSAKDILNCLDWKGDLAPGKMAFSSDSVRCGATNADFKEFRLDGVSVQTKFPKRFVSVTLADSAYVLFFPGESPRAPR